MAFGSNNPKVVVEVTGDASQYKGTLDDAIQKTGNLGQQFKQVGSNMSQIGRTMTAMFTVPIVAAAATVGNEFINLDRSMRNIQSISQMTDSEIETLRKSFIDLSKDQTATTESASALADAYYFIQSAGFAGAEGMDILKVSTKAASAGLTDTNTAANAIMGVLHAYNMSASEAGHVSDVLFKTVDQGVITFEDLASGLGRLTNTANVAGVSLEEIGAAMVVLTRRGMPPAEAFTALNQVMSKLAAPTDKILQSAKDLGIDISYTALKTKGFGAILSEIASKGDEAFFSLFGNNVRALKGIVGLAADGVKDYNEALDGMKTASDGVGRTQMAFNEQTKSVSAQLAFLRNDLMAVGMTLLQIIMPYLQMGVKLLEQFASWLSNLSPTTQKWIVVLLVLLAVLGPLLMTLGALVSGVGAVITIFTAISAPIWIVIAAIVALIAVVALVYLAWKNNWFGMRDTVNEVVTFIKATWQTFMNWWLAFSTGKLGTWSEVFRNTFLAIKIFINQILIDIQLIMKAWHQARTGDWYGFGQTLRQIWDGNWKTMIAILRLAFANVELLFHDTFNRIRNWWHSIDWTQLGKDIGRGILNGLNSMGSSLYQAIVRIGQNMLNAFKGFWGIHSPSTLMSDQFKYLAQGAILGWEEEFKFSPQAINQQMMTMYGYPSTTYSGDQNGRIIGLLEQLNRKDNRMDESVLVRAFRDAVLMIKD